MEAITERFADAEKFKNKHWGETCIIVGNGPSLDQVPLAFLKSYPTFASNYIHLLDNFFPTYYTVGSYNVIQTPETQGWVRPIIEASEAAFVSKLAYDKLKAPNVYPINTSRCFMFSLNPHKWVHLGANCTVTNLQFAYWMGFTTVYLVGVDHDYSGWKTGAPLHFNDEKYPVDGQLRPMLVNPQGKVLVDEGYLECARVYMKSGRKVINLNPFSLLEAFDKKTPMIVGAKGKRLVNEAYRECARTFETHGREVINLNPESHLEVFIKKEPEYAIHSSDASQRGTKQATSLVDHARQLGAKALFQIASKLDI